MGGMATEAAVAGDGQEYAVHSGGQDLLVSWHPPAAAPDGRRHGAEGVCVDGAGQVVLVSPDGVGWTFPAGRPEDAETWEETLRREVREEACATIVRARLLGFSRGACIAGPEQGPGPGALDLAGRGRACRVGPQFEMSHRRVVAPTDLSEVLALGTHPFAPIVRRTLREADLT
ncbi:MAG: NUDIX domain-containing protein [Propionibacteriales bacterium]|nr:NUDIX domain-containing protein [Propionibacteriales bacterium]